MDYLDGLINVDKINKDLLFKGEKGKYLAISIMPCPGNEFSSHMIVQKHSKKDYEWNKALKLTANYDKTQLINAAIIGNLNLFSTQAPLTEKEKEDVF